MKRLFSIMILVLSTVALLASCGGGGGGGASTPLSDAKAITEFSFTSPAATGAIDEGAKTISVTVPYGTNVAILVATFTTTGASVEIGNVVQESGVTQNDFTNAVAYIVTAADGSTATYSVIVTVALNTAKAITAFSIAGATGTINEGAKTISVTMPYGTNKAGLIASFSTTGASVEVGGVVQESGSTQNNFTNPVEYVVTAADGSTATYSVIVTVALNTAKAITSFSLAGVAGTINEGAKTISVTMPYGTNKAGLIASFSTTGASVEVGGVVQESGSTQNNFTNPVEYVVTAADGSTVTYSVTVTVALNTAKAITAFSVAGAAGTINEGAKTISVTAPYGTNLTALIATFTTTGASVKVSGVVQKNGVTQNNFTNSVAYVVTAADGSTATYTVTVTVLSRFTDNGDGTMTDNSTGLMWIKAPVNDFRLWQESLDYSRALSFAGYDDWYMPTIDDLQVLINGWTGASPAAWLTSQGFSNVPGYYSWSSSTWADSTASAWVVYMGHVYYTGTILNTIRKIGEGGCNVWPVRGKRFRDNGNGTITDRYNGLIWLKAPDTTKRTWQGAIDYCNGLVFAGSSYWRLPAIGELQELINGWTGAYPFDWLTSQGFSNIKANYWSSTQYTPPNDVYYAWYMRMDVGSPAYGDKDYDYIFINTWPVSFGP